MTPYKVISCTNKFVFSTALPHQDISSWQPLRTKPWVTM